MSNEISPILVTHFLGNKLSNVFKKEFGSLFKCNEDKEKEKKKRMVIAKRFALNANAIMLCFQINLQISFN